MDRRYDYIAGVISSVKGWLNYFTKSNPSAVKYTINCLNRQLVKWAMGNGQWANTRNLEAIVNEPKNG